MCNFFPSPFLIFQVNDTESVCPVALRSADLGNPVSLELSMFFFSHLLLLAFVSVAVGDSLRSRSGKTGAFL